MLKSRWEQFKQSTIARIFIGYSLVAWVLIQLIEAVLPTFEAPLWVAQTLLFILIIGFPLALLAGWVLESKAGSPMDGAQKTQATHNYNRKTVAIIGVGVVCFVGLFGFYMMPFIFHEGSTQEESDHGLAGKLQGIPSGSLGTRSFLNIGNTSINDWGLRTEIAMSNNGRYLAFTSNKEGYSEIFVRDLWREESVKKLAEYSWATDVHGVLKFSEDGDWIYFFDAGILKRVRVEGGVPQALLDTTVNATSGYAALSDFVIFTGAKARLQKLVLRTGDIEPINIPDEESSEGYMWHRWPDILPGGTHMLYTEARLGATNEGNVFIFDFEKGEKKEILFNAYNARYTQSGHIVFVRGSALWAVPFDLASMQIVGRSELVVENLHSQGQVGAAVYAFSHAGHLIYLKGIDAYAGASATNLSWVSRSGELEPINLPRNGRISSIQLSPAGDKILYTQFTSTQDSDIWVWDIDKKSAGRRTFSGRANHGIWDAQGNLIIYPDGKDLAIYGVESSGAGQRRLLRGPDEVSRLPARPHAILSDNKSMLISKFKADGILEFFMTRAGQTDPQGDSGSMVLLEVAPTGALSGYSLPQISPDQNWVAYASSESGMQQIYIRPFPNVDEGKWQISFANATSPLWSERTNEIFFWSGGAQYSVAYQTSAITQKGKPSYIDLSTPKKIMSIKGLQNGLTLPAWDYDSENDRFLMLETQSSASSQPGMGDNLVGQTQLVFVHNWFEELATLVPSQ